MFGYYFCAADLLTKPCTAHLGILTLAPPHSHRVTIGGDDDSSEQQLLTPFSAAAAQQALRYMQEYVAEPFSTKTNSAKTWVSRPAECMPCSGA